MARTDTLVHRLANWAAKQPDRPAIRGKADGAWVAFTWREYWEAVRETARGILALGHKEGECVAIVGDNSPEWVIAQFGIMAVRGIPAPIYTTNTDEQTAYIVSHSRAKIAICDKQAQHDKYLRCIENKSMSVDHIVTLERVKTTDARTMTLDALRKLGRETKNEKELDDRLAALTTDETALLIYTSGTTGVPKAVTLEHGGMCEVADAVVDNFPPLKEPGKLRLVSYLPLCHVAEQLFTNFLHLATGGEVYFCPDLKQVKDYLVEARPTLFLGVPRVWEKFQAVLEARLAEATGIKAALARWARKTELEAFKREIKEGRPVNTFQRRYANKLVLSKVKEKLGLDQLIAAATGAAPISVETLEFFASLGVVIYEGYGMSETTGVATVPEFGKPRFGTVGRPLKGVQVKIDNDGEILLKGRGMTRGYLHSPDKTAELIDAEGWLHTGDLGETDESGSIRITGRKKDLIITAGGKNIAPSEMEGYLKGIPNVGQAVVIGDRKAYLVALLTIDPEALPDMRTRFSMPDASIADIARSDQFRRYVEPLIESECNARVARYQQIKKFTVLPVEFSVEGGELTPTMKIKRNVVHEKYAAEIEALYAEDEAAQATA
jgi:long-chain acyl-CoA synthetase